MNKIYPFKFLDAYDKDDTGLFFGRDEEINALYQMVFQSNMLMIYGASGTGKTSLIQCGLAGRFQSHDWLALFIRRGNNLNAALEKAIADAGGNTEPSDDYIDLSELMDDEPGIATIAKRLSPLAKSFKAVYLNSFRPIYLIFDQFEELFILGSKDEQKKFVTTIQEILNVEQPVKMIFSIREEYLGHLYEFEKAVPQLMRKKLRVEPMNLDKVRQVINGVATFKGSNIGLKNGEEQVITENIFDKIKGGDKTLTIQLPYLQVFLDKLYLLTTHDETRRADAVFSLDSIVQMGDIGDVLRDFLEDQVKTISQKLSTDSKPISADEIWKILSPFATLEGTKEPISMQNLQERLPGMDSKLVKDTVAAFVNSRILRQSEDGTIYELAHDTLAGKIAAKRTDEEIALLEVKRLIKGQVTLKKDAQELFSEKQLNFIDPYLLKLTLTQDENDLILKSRKNVKKRKKIKIVQFAFVILGLITFLLAIWSWNLFIEARTATSVAIVQKNAAVNQKHEAESAKQFALAAKDSAELSKQMAIEQQKIATAQEHLALLESDKAKEAKEDAVHSAMLADSSRNNAQRSESLAKQSEITAEENRMQAVAQKIMADRLLRLAESKNDARKGLLFLNEQRYDSLREYAIKAYDSNRNNNGNFQDNDIYNALLMSWVNLVNNKQSVETTSSIKTMIGLPHSNIIFIGDEIGDISTWQNTNGLLKKMAKINTGLGLKSLAIDPSENYLLAVMSNRVVLCKLGDDKALNILSTIPLAAAGMHGVFLNSNSFLVQSASGVNRYEIKNPAMALDSIGLNNCSDIAISNNGNIFISSGNKIYQFKNWENISGNPINTFVLKSNVTCLSLDKSGKYLAAGTYDGGIWLKNPGQLLPASYKVLHRSMVNEIKFCTVAPDRLQLASVSGDKTVKLTEVNIDHTLNTDDLVTITEHSNWVNCIFYTPDGKYLFSGSEDHSLKCWPTTMWELYNNIMKK